MTSPWFNLASEEEVLPPYPKFDADLMQAAGELLMDMDNKIGEALVTDPNIEEITVVQDSILIRIKDFYKADPPEFFVEMKGTEEDAGKLIDLLNRYSLGLFAERHYTKITFKSEE